MANDELPDKLFFKIGEVAQIVGVRPHVLRYWEGEFPALRPMKTRGAHRVYRRRDVELAVLVKRLLQDQGFTITGARKRLKELGRDRVSSEPDPEAKREVNVRAELLWVRRELTDLLQQIEHAATGHGESEPTPVRATVTSAVPSAVRARGRTRA